MKYNARYIRRQIQMVLYILNLTDWLTDWLNVWLTNSVLVWLHKTTKDLPDEIHENHWGSGYFGRHNSFLEYLKNTDFVLKGTRSLSQQQQKYKILRMGVRTILHTRKLKIFPRMFLGPLCCHPQLPPIFMFVSVSRYSPHFPFLLALFFQLPFFRLFWYLTIFFSCSAPEFHVAGNCSPLLIHLLLVSEKC
jgi:hypothetical protein